MKGLSEEHERRTRIRVPCGLPYWLALVADLVAVSFAVGCQNGPRENAPTALPSTSTISIVPPLPVTTTTAPTTAVTRPNPPLATGPMLTPNAEGARAVLVLSKSGLTYCEVYDDQVACFAKFNNPPLVGNGVRPNIVIMNSSGTIKWVQGDSGFVAVPVRMDYGTYHALDWTIVAEDTGTTFTNDRTRHGMRVSVQSVTPF